jgi:hypothetical protein
LGGLRGRGWGSLELGASWLCFASDMGCASSSQVKETKPVVHSQRGSDRALTHTNSLRSTFTDSSGEITDDNRENPSRRGSRDVDGPVRSSYRLRVVTVNSHE